MRHHKAFRVVLGSSTFGFQDVFVTFGCSTAPMFLLAFGLRRPIHVRLYEVAGGVRPALVWRPAEVETKWIGDDLHL